MSCRWLCWAFAALLLMAGCSEDNSGGPTAPPETPPSAPSNLYVSSTRPDLVRLRWTINSDDETGFRLERRIGQPGGEAAEFALLDTVPANRASFDDRVVQAGQTYTYRVLAYAGRVRSEPSNSVTVQAVANNSPTVISPQPANGLTNVDPDEPMILSWVGQDLDGEDLVYDVYFGASRMGVTKVASGQTEASYIVTQTLEHNAFYFWRVMATDPKGVSYRSPLWVFTTLVDRDLVPAGPFVMGAVQEFPMFDTLMVHPGNPVQTSAFSMDRHLVTNQQYANFLNQRLASRSLQFGPGGEIRDEANENVWCTIRPHDMDSDIFFSVSDSAFVVIEGRGRFPVVEVSWFGADEFARHYGRRLPTEAEWEKAARGTGGELGHFPVGEDSIGIGLPYPYGVDFDLAAGNYLNSGDPYEGARRVQTTPIGFFDGAVHGGFATRDGSSPFGIYDMSGNVWEWTADWYALYRKPHRPPRDSDPGYHFKVIRGGSFNRPYGSATTFNRAYLNRDVSDRAIGFRTVATVN